MHASRISAPSTVFETSVHFIHNTSLKECIARRYDGDDYAQPAINGLPFMRTVVRILKRCSADDLLNALERRCSPAGEEH